MTRKINLKDKRLAALAAVVIIIAGIALAFPTPERERGFAYKPTSELPEDYMIFVNQPMDENDMIFIAMLSSITERDGYHPMFILDNGELDQHQLWAIQHMDNKDIPKLIFSDVPDIHTKLQTQLNEEIPEENVYVPGPTTLAKFKGYDDFISIGSYREALWVAPLAKAENKVMIRGESTFSSQQEVWDKLDALGVPANYLVVTNPDDFDAPTLAMNTPAFDNYDTKFHVNALSVLAAQLAAHHDAYVLTDITPSNEEIGTMDVDLNVRAIGTYLAIKNFSAMYGIPEYICIVGSAAAVPQFQMPSNGDGDVLVNSDVMYGFLDDNQYTMDSAVGRFINLNLPGASNQMAKTLAYEHLTDRVTVDYSDIAGGTQDINWKQHGASFSGYEITYERLQATPARWICEDYEDEGMEYEYVGPSGSGELIGDGTKNSDEQDLGTICEASGFVAYRGHGSDYGSLYTLRVYTDSDVGKLSYDQAAQLNLPPQVAFFVSCMNAKIHGTGYGEDADDVEYEKLFGVNYLYGGALAVGGATEVSYSNIGQDIDSLWARYGAGLLHDDNHEWDLNDAWYAFFWDGLINHEEEYGTVGKALQWAENRYIKYHDSSVSPFEWTDDSNMGGHWKEVTMFVIYGDPAFRPGLTSQGGNSFDHWHNGPDDY